MLATLLAAAGVPRSELTFQRMIGSDTGFDDTRDSEDATPEAAISILPMGYGRSREIRRREVCTDAFLRECQRASMQGEATCQTAADWLTGRRKLTAVP